MTLQSSIEYWTRGGLTGQTDRPMPNEMAVVGAGNIGPDIAYFLRTGLPDKKLYLVDVVEEPLKKAEQRFQGYAKKGMDRKKMTPEMAEKVLNNIISWYKFISGYIALFCPLCTPHRRISE